MFCRQRERVPTLAERVVAAYHLMDAKILIDTVINEYKYLYDYIYVVFSAHNLHRRMHRFNTCINTMRT